MGNSKSQQSSQRYVEESVRKKARLTRNYTGEFPEYDLVSSRSGPIYPHDDVLGPVRFHDTHGMNITVSNGGRVASRTNSFCYAIAFTSRSIRVEERVKIRLKRVESGWSGVMRFGFTVNDPSRLHQDELPRYACPDLTNQPGYWAKALPIRFAKQNNVVSFYVSTAGCVFYAINDKLEGLFLEGVDVSRQIWGLFDVYGNTTSLQLLNDGEGDLVLPSIPDPRPVKLPQNMLRQVKVRLQVNDLITPISFSATMGKQLKCRNRIHVTRKDVEVESGLAFTSAALKPGETAYFYCAETKPNRICVIEDMGFGVGVTTCDPSSIPINELPFDAMMLVDRPEYWVLYRQFEPPIQSEYFALTIEKGGFVSYTREGIGKSVLFHVDVSQPLYLVIDMCANVSSLAIIGMSAEPELEDVPEGRTSSEYQLPDQNNDDPALSLNFLNDTILNRSLIRDAEAAGTSHDDENPENNSFVGSLYPHQSSSEGASSSVYPHGNNEASGASGGAMAAAAPMVVSALSWIGRSVANRLGNTDTEQPDGAIPTVPYVFDTPSPSSEGSGNESGGEEAFFNAHEDPESSSTDNDLETELRSNSRLLEMLTGDLEEILRPLELADGAIREELIQLRDGEASGVNPTKTEGNKSNDKSNKNSEKECVVCCDNVVNAVVYSCGHACLCFECGQVILKQNFPTCPICRARVIDIIRLYQA